MPPPKKGQAKVNINHKNDLSLSHMETLGNIKQLSQKIK